jgi:hypothetical protein
METYPMINLQDNSGLLALGLYNIYEQEKQPDESFRQWQSKHVGAAKFTEADVRQVRRAIAETEGYDTPLDAMQLAAEILDR